MRDHRLVWKRLGSLGLVALVTVLCGNACAGVTPEVVPSLSAPLVVDDFSPPQAAWARFDTEESAVYAQDGELFLEDRGRDVAVYSPLTGRTYQDVGISVNVRHVQGTVDNWMGVICRQLDEDNYYLLAISADGYYLILRVEAGTATPLAGPKSSDAIRIGKAENVMEVKCRGSSLSMRVNGTFLVARSDAVLSEPGYVALFSDAVGSGASSTTAFDDFALVEP